MAIVEAFLALAICSLYLLYTLHASRRRKLPPGPFQLPIIGSLIQIFLADWKYPHRAFTKLAKKYGNVLWLRVGSVDTVVLNGYDVIKAALTENEDFLNRIDDDWLLEWSFGKPQGLFSSRVEFWKPTRNFTMKHLKTVGFGKKDAMQDIVRDELEAIMRDINVSIENNAGTVSPHILFQLPSLNLAWAAVAGQRFDHDDPQVLELLRLMSEIFRTAKVTGGLLGTFPWLQRVAPRLFNSNALISLYCSSQIFMKELIQTEKDKGTYRAVEPQNLLEAFLQKIEFADKSDKNSDIFTEENLISVLSDLFAGTADSTSATLAFACLWLVMHPDVQEKCYQEIVESIGTHRLPLVWDKMDLPYVRATTLEVHRRSTISPLLVHKIYKDTQFREFVIPENSRVLVNLHSVNMDSETWGDPENFRPERFLDSEGRIVNENKVLAFSIGKRECPAKHLADTAIFYFLAGVIQKYKLVPVPGQKYEAGPVPGFIVTTAPFRVTMKPRQEK